MPWTGATFPSENPASGEVLCQVARGTAATIDEAVASAHAAFPAWSHTTPAERKKALQRMADILEENKYEVPWFSLFSVQH